jgi:hypothetical protein
VRRTRVLLALLAIACASPTAPADESPAPVGPCRCCQAFPFDRGYALILCTTFNPCPSDSALAATGWHRIDR